MVRRYLVSLFAAVLLTALLPTAALAHAGGAETSATLAGLGLYVVGAVLGYLLATWYPSSPEP